VAEYRGSLTEDDFVEAARLRRRVIREAGTAEDPTLWFGAGFLALAMWGLFRRPDPTPETLWWLPFALLCFALWWRRRVNPRVVWRKEAGLRDECRGVVSARALEARLGGIDATIPWTFFSSHLASGRAIVLFVGTHLNLILAKSMFATDEAWSEARSIIQGSVPRATEEHGTSPRRLRRTLGWVLLLLAVFLAWHFATIQKR
jgi:hypothetical protein